jgi:hypothetical protein
VNVGSEWIVNEVRARRGDYNFKLVTIVTRTTRQVTRDSLQPVSFSSTVWACTREILFSTYFKLCVLIIFSVLKLLSTALYLVQYHTHSRTHFGTGHTMLRDTLVKMCPKYEVDVPSVWVYEED